MNESGKKSIRSRKAFRPLVVWAMTLNSTLGKFLMGYVLAVLNPIQNYLTIYVYNWSLDTGNTRISVLNSMIPVGIAIGSLVGGSAAQKYGRWKSMIFSDLLAILGLGLTLFANFPLFVIGRMITGICSGLNASIVPVYIAEIAPLPMMGTTGSANGVLITFGSFVAFLFAFGVPTNGPGDSSFWHNWWRIMLGVPIITCIMRTLILATIFKTETPKYLLFNDKEEEAKKALSLIYIDDFVTEQFISLKREKETGHNTAKLKYTELFSKKYRMRFFIGCFVGLSQQMAGFPALLFYSTTIFQESSHGNANLAVTYTALFGALNLIATIFSGQIMKRLSRKTILIAGDLGMTLCILIIILLSVKSFNVGDYSPIPIFAYVIIFGLSYSPIVFVFTVELLPDIGVGMVILLNSLGGLMVALFFPPLQLRAGNSGAFAVFGAYLILALFVWIFCVKDTRGLTPIEINERYNPKVKATDNLPVSPAELKEVYNQKIEATENIPSSPTEINGLYKEEVEFGPEIKQY